MKWKLTLTGRDLMLKQELLLLIHREQPLSSQLVVLEHLYEKPANPITSTRLMEIKPDLTEKCYNGHKKNIPKLKLQKTFDT